MKRITIKIQDSLYDPMISLFEQLGKDKIEIVSTEKQLNNNLKIKIKKLLSQTSIKIFKEIKDPIKWQREQRDEWR